MAVPLKCMGTNKEICMCVHAYTYAYTHARMHTHTHTTHITTNLLHPGSVGFLASLYFVRKIFSIVKID